MGTSRPPEHHPETGSSEPALDGAKRRSALPDLTPALLEHRGRSRKAGRLRTSPGSGSNDSHWSTLETAVAPLLARAAQAALAVAFSGGLDSTVLLARLAAAPLLRGRGLRAVHVHHGWSEQADVWAGHCAAVCARLGLPLTVLRVRMERGPGRGGREAAARRARYAALAEDQRAGEWLLTAHHADDQAETLLLQLFRGAGLDGLGGMHPRARVLGTRVWRPLLAVPRSTLQAYAHAHDLRWIEDPSNRDPGLARGLLRTAAWPAWALHWPQLATTLVQTAAHLRADARLLRTQVAQALAGCRTLDPEVLSTTALLALPLSLQARVLRQWLREAHDQLPRRTWITQLISELRSVSADAAPRWRQGHIHLQAWGGLLRRGPLAATPAWEIPDWAGEVIDLPCALGRLRWQGPPVRWQLHGRRGGERLLWHGRKRPLKHILQSLRVPAWQRCRLILVSERQADATLVLRAVVGVVVDDVLHGWLAAGARLEHAAAPSP